MNPRTPLVPRLATRFAARSLALALAALLLLGCAGAHGMNRGPLQRQLALEAPATEDSIQAVLDLKPQLQPPFKVGVVFRQADESAGRHYDTWTWPAHEKQAVLEQLEAMPGMISEAFVVSTGTIASDDLAGLRLAAARHGADALLVVSGSAGVVNTPNLAAILDLTIVCAFFIPAHDIETLFLMGGTLWDVRSGYLYASWEAEGGAEESQPGFRIKEFEVIDEARGVALEVFREQLAFHVGSLAPLE